jgi:hypothetical protein
MNPYQKLQERKRKWTPVQTSAGTCKEGAEEAIHRALALRHMELPVGDFINDALATDIPDLARDLLVSNVRDEENHDLALGYIANAYGVDPQAEKEAMALRKAWVTHPDHTVCKAMVAERAIFFVLLPFFLVCEQSVPTSLGMNKSTLHVTRSSAASWDSDRLIPWIN